MVDLTRRNVLITIGGSALITAVPTIAKGAPGLHSFADDTAHQLDSLVPLTGDTRYGTEISISLQIDAQPILRLTNHTESLIIVRHVYPGVVHAGDDTFDINSVFSRSAYAVGAGKTRTIKIRAQTETSQPSHAYSDQPQGIVTVVAASASGQLLSSTNSYYV